MNNLRAVIISALCGIVCALIIGCGGAPEQGDPPGMPVTTALVTKADVPRYIETIGNIVAISSVDVVPQVTGTVQAVHFQQGSEVKEGDVLISIDARPYEAALKQAQGELDKSKAMLADNDAQLRRAQSLARDDFVSKQALESLKAQVGQTTGTIQANQGRVQAAQIDLERCSIKAPIGGVTSWLKVDVGNVVSAANPVPLVTIRAMDQVYVDFDLAEKFIDDVRTAMSKGTLRVRTSLVDDPSIVGDAELLLLDNQVLAGAGTVRLRAKLQNAERRFWPGQLARAKLILETLNAQTLVPEQTVQLSQQGHYVFVVSPEKKAEFRLIEIGQLQDGGLRTVTKGLNEGEKVVLTGHLLLAPGAPVMELPPPGQTPPAAAESKASEQKG